MQVIQGEFSPDSPLFKERTQDGGSRKRYDFMVHSQEIAAVITAYLPDVNCDNHRIGVNLQKL